jgi:ubiquitin-protein ligase
VGRNRRILDELANVSLNADPDLGVYVVGTDIGEWKTYIKGPRDTPYSRRWWALTVTFPATYPDEPPLFRFDQRSIPWHMNVSLDGLVCLDILSDMYKPSTTVLSMLLAVRSMFERALPLYAVSIEKLDRFFSDQDGYIKIASDVGPEVHPTKEEWLKGVRIIDDPKYEIVPPAPATGPDAPPTEPRVLRPATILGAPSVSSLDF